MISATANLLDLTKLSQDIKATADELVRERRRQLLDRIAERARNLYNSTVLDWAGGGREPQITPGYKKKITDTPEFTFSAPEETDDSISQSIATINKLWIKLDKGIERRKVGSEPEFFVPMASPRTKPTNTVPGVLYNPAFQGSYKDELRVHAPGSTVAAIPPRKWTETIAHKLQEEFGPVARKMGLEFTVTITD